MLSLPWPFSTSAPSSSCTCTLNCGHDSQCPLYRSEKNDHQAEDAVARLLAHYATPSGACPPSARVDPTLAARAGRGRPGVSDLWYLGTFIASKATDLAIDFTLHHTRGPRKKSWGIEMTLISSFMRGVARHTRLTDITMLRLFMQLGSLVPPPPDALVTPVSFRIKSRGLRGLLAPFDELEHGGAQRPKDESDEPRELSGEWVVGKELWTRLNKQWLQEKRHHGVGHRVPERVILYLHGGAYYVFSAATHRLITIPLSKYADARVFAVDYRLAPETRFPGALHDAVHAYRRLTDELHVPPSRILIAGDSAGGGLTLALLMYLRDEGYELPGGAILFSPWVDLTMSCDSWDSNADIDVVPRPDADDPLNPVACYLGWGENMKKYITHPYASPLFGDFKGLPPLLIQSGDSEVLRDEITLLAHKATMAGVDVRHELFEDAVHVFQMFPFLPTTRRAFQNVRSFVKQLDEKLSVAPLAKSATNSDAGSPDLGLGSDAERDLRDEMNANAESSHVVGMDGQEVATGRVAGLKLADDDEQPTESEQSTPANGLGLDLGAPINTSSSSTHLASHLNGHTPRLHHRGFTSPLIRMTPITPSASTATSPNTLPRSLSSSWMAVSPSASVPHTPRVTSPVPPPSIRLRSRALSHPDVADLVASFAARPGVVRTTTFSACGDENEE